MSFSERKKQFENIINELDEKYQTASSWLPFSALEISETFSKEELVNLERFVEDMEKATSDNERLKIITDKIQKYGSTILSTLKLARVI